MSENIEAVQSAIEPVKEKAKESLTDGMASAGEIVLVAGEFISAAGEVIGGIVGGIGEALGALGDLG